MALIIDIAPPPKALPPKKRWLSRPRLIEGGSLLVILIVIALIFLNHSTPTNIPVPESVRKAVNFHIYYPNQQKLPYGYSLDTTSFRLAEPGVVIYSVVSPDNQRLVFSEEQKPEQGVIDKFTTSSIPLHTEVKTGLGQAEFGAYGTGKNLRSVVSLPINGGPWLIITAPSSSNHDDLVHIIQALTK